MYHLLSSGNPLLTVSESLYPTSWRCPSCLKRRQENLCKKTGTIARKMHLQAIVLLEMERRNFPYYSVYRLDFCADFAFDLVSEINALLIAGAKAAIAHLVHTRIVARSIYPRPLA